MCLPIAVVEYCNMTEQLKKRLRPLLGSGTVNTLLHKRTSERLLRDEYTDDKRRTVEDCVLCDVRPESK
jgi:hypothetical protein